MKSLLRALAIVSILATLLVGCATIPAGVAGSTVIVPSPLKLSIGYDLAFVRVDLKRATHLALRFIRQPGANGKTKVIPEPIKVENPYNYLVATFGNGLVVDYNGNLGIDLLRLYHLNRATGYDVVERFNGLFPEGGQVVKSGSRLTRKGIGITIGHLSAVADGDIVQLHGEVFHPRMRIVRKPDSISLEPAGRHNLNTTTIEQPSPTLVMFLETGGNTTFRQLDANHIQSSDGLELARVGNHISIVLRSPGGIVASLVFYRTKSGCLITSSDGYPLTRVSRLGDTIYVTSGRFLAAAVTINSEEH